MREHIETMLLELDDLINDKNPELYSVLGPGDDNESFNTDIHVAIKELWTWRNGQSPDYSGNFHSKTNEMLMSYQEAIEVRDELNDYVECGDISGENWRRDWLPFTENGGGNYMCISLGSGEVFYFDKYETSTGFRFPSLAAWLEDLIEGYKKL